MKAFVLATALVWSGVALAQVSPPADDPSGQMPSPDASMPSEAPMPDSTMPAPNMPAPDATMPAPDATPTMPAPTDSTMTPPANPNAAPMGTMDNSMTAPAPSTKDYPKCTRKLRDNCINPGGR